MAQLPATKTPMTAAQALYVLGSALGSDAAALPMVAAQSAVETAHWAAMWRWNFGNVTAGPGEDYQILPGNPLHFKVYESAEDGARDYVRWLRTRGVLAYAIRGDLDGYIENLKSHGYLGFIGRAMPNGRVVSQSDYDQYARGIAGLIHTFASMTPQPFRSATSSLVRMGSTRGRKIVTVGAVAGLGIALAILAAGSSGKRAVGPRS
jgi:hypothetical protein